MGVNGLWKLLEASGKPVPVETLENKVLAVDVSIWLHQLTKGGGGAVQNAHLIGLYHRILKLLFFKIKPVFVFDGGVPELKKQTIAHRRNLKSKAASNADKVRSDLLKNLLEQQLVNDVLGKKEMALPPPSVSREVDMFELPPAPKHSSPNKEDGESEPEDAESTFRYADLHSVDINSEQFRSLPPDMRHEILTELLEQRKLSSWHKMHEMPQESDNFSSYQMERLLKRRAIQKKLDETAGELGEHVISLGELESMFIKEGVLAKRVASNANERVVYHTLDPKEAACSSQDSEEKTDNLLDEAEKDILDMIREEEENEMDLDEVEGVGEDVGERKKKSGGEKEEVKIKITREMLAEQQKILDSLVKKKAKDDEVDLTEESESGFMFDESEIIEQSQILASIQQRQSSQNILPTAPSIAKPSIEVTIDPNKPPIDLTDDIFGDIFNSESNTNKLVKSIDTAVTKCSKNVTQEPQSKKIIEITLDPNKIKDVIGSEDIFSDVFNTTSGSRQGMSSTTSDKDVQEIEDDEDILMSDTSSESSNDTPTIINNPTIGSHIKENTNIKDSSNTKDIGKERTGNDLHVKDNTNIKKTLQHSEGSLEKQIFDEVDEASGEDDAIMSDDSDSSVEDITKVCEFISETNAVRGVDNQKVNNGIDKSDLVKELSSESVIRTVSDVNVEANGNKNTTNESSENNVPNKAELPRETGSQSSQLIQTINSNVDDIDEIREALPTNESTTVSTLPSTSSPVSNTPVSSIASSSQAVSTIKQILSTRDSSEPEESQDGDSLLDIEKAFDAVPSTSRDTGSKSSYFGSNLNETQTKKLLEYQSTLERDRDSLLLERGKQTRLAATITEQMSREAQELLSLFGVPYIVAPGEAEAQCAGLEMCSLTQGVITDDSDIWLFGANTVYKNFFDKKSHVLRYTAPDIQYYFELTRERLIQLALLVGSDYTPGLPGVGPVTALEILAKFSPPSSAPSTATTTHHSIVDGMRRFRTWLGKKNKPDSPLTRKLRNVKLNDDFPNVSVVQAYLKPDVSTSAPALKWGTPDLEGLRKFANLKFGWSQSRVDQTLIPIIKKISQRSNQMTLDMFYKNKVVIPKRSNPVSKRVRSAVDKSKSKRLREEVVLSESDSD